jgi:serine phosphatase RsbU (regulator of sigma subunit)
MQESRLDQSQRLQRPTPGFAPSAREFFLHSLPGRLLLIGLSIKLITWPLEAAGLQLGGLLGMIDRIGGLALLVSAGYLVYRLTVLAKRRLLWRVRRKLILSYIFIGLVPALLIVIFFALCGLLLFFNVSSYLVRASLAGLTDEAQFLAETTALEISKGPGVSGASEVLARKQSGFATRYPGASVALVPTPAEPCVPAADRPDAATRFAGSRFTRQIDALTAGPWSHLHPPEVLPGWVSCSGFGGLLAYSIGAPNDADIGSGTESGAASDAEIRLVIRAVGLPEVSMPRYAIIVDVPVSEAIAEQLREETGIKLGKASLASFRAGQEVRALPGRQRDLSPAASGAPEEAGDGRSGPNGWLRWVVLLEHRDWGSGLTDNLTLAIALSIAEIYDRLSAAEAPIGSYGIGSLLLYGVMAVAVLFLVIEAAALMMGMLLARSITGSVHELTIGTERVRQGDFKRKIKVQARDQLGELALSFNAMTESIEGLMVEAAEKKRLEEEMRLAREIQRSLLPQGPVEVEGLEISAICRPALAVGGDYYDFFPLDDGRLGVLIADVSGKGTSAALYMAELKGLLLSLSQVHGSPRDLLIDANRIISKHLSARSFITATYAIVDMAAGTMTYARAGHTPLIYRPNPDGRLPKCQTLTPDGLVLGLRIDSGEMFESLLVEASLALRKGDLLLFFTDGISEAMNHESECFGEERLTALVEEHGHLTPAELRERIIREVDAFAVPGQQHDDLTMIIVSVQEVASRVAGAAQSGVSA